MAYRVYRVENYIFVVDNDSKTLFQESSSNVLVKKQNLNDAVYDIIFYREQAQVQPFYNLSVDNGDILDENGDPYYDAYLWEKWYTANTGISDRLPDPGPGPITGVSINPTIIKSNNTTGSIGASVYSISFANTGTAKALVSFDSGTTYVDIPPNTSINMDAGSVLNTYSGGIFAYDTVTYPGAYLIITYNS